MNNKFILLIILLNCSCASLNRTIPDYALIKNGSIIGSNSSVLLPAEQLEAKAEFKNNLLSIDYPILIKNTHSKQVASIYLSNSVIETNKINTPVKCNEIKDGRTTIFIEPQQLAGVLCQIRLKPDKDNKLALRDTRAALKIQVTEGVNSTLDFPIVLRMEDFNE